MNVVTRFAPSPTGFMHVGGVRTALYAWLFARKHNGRFILRIEDTDKEREVEGSIPHIIESLTWLGIEWDEGVDKGGPHAPYLQSERLTLYQEYAKRLVALGYAYPDPYSEKDLDAFRSQAEHEHRPFLIRDHRPADSEVWDGVQPLRFRTPEIKRYTWNDAVRGELSAGEEALDDFILIKGDGYPTYNFAHVVDDIEMGVTHVMRGEEFISSTPKFLSLYDALSIKPPLFATMPVILGPDGKKKLSKRDGAKDILEYRADGYMPEAVLNFLALLGWNPGTDQEYFTKEELLEAFDLPRIHSSGAHFNEPKLLSMNQHWMRKLSDEDFLRLGNLSASNPERLLKAVPMLKERAHTFNEAKDLLAGELSCLFEEPALDASILVAKESPDAPKKTREHLLALKDLVAKLDSSPSIETVKAALMPYADREGRGAVLWPLRYALSGKEKSPDPFTLISIKGVSDSISSIQKAIDILDR